MAGGCSNQHHDTNISQIVYGDIDLGGTTKELQYAGISCIDMQNGAQKGENDVGQGDFLKLDTEYKITPPPHTEPHAVISASCWLPPNSLEHPISATQTMRRYTHHLGGKTAYFCQFRVSQNAASHKFPVVWRQATLKAHTH